MNLIFEDAKSYPLLFSWNGSLENKRATIPLLEARTVGEDIRRFWLATGGGSVFETETLLSPDPAASESIDLYGASILPHELAKSYLLFHTGFVHTVVDTAQGDLITMTLEYAELRRFRTLDEWYVGTLRTEYEGRYGLKPLAGCQ